MGYNEAKVEAGRPVRRLFTVLVRNNESSDCFLAEKRQDLTVVLTGIFLMTSDAEHFS